jgi:2-C-methyl-D-erythritol 4-phosphate cytidylyltransferase
MKFGAIITAGGASTRYGNTNKLLEKIYDKEVIRYVVDAYKKANISEIVICAHKSIKPTLQKIFPDIKIIEGGTTRQESVYKGICAIHCEYVLIHDGARPMITPELIEKVKNAVIQKRAISAMTKTIDTIKEVDTDGKIIQTIDRTKLYNTQTPQAFEYNLIKSVHEKFLGQNFTDDAGMVELFGQDVFIVEGDYRNIKITTKSDLEIAKAYLNQICQG